MCCLFGLMDYKHTLTAAQKSRILSVLSRECEVRGTDATGIAYNSGGKLRIYKRPIPAHKLTLNIPADAAVVMGHTRMTTQGDEKYNRNNHPFAGNINHLNFALAHNGVLYNDISLRNSMKLPNTRIQTDSYIAVQLIEHKRALDLNSLKFMAEEVKGSFSFTVLDGQNNLYFIKGDNPLCIYRYPKAGLFIYASTEEILNKALARLNLSFGKPERLDITCGDIWRLDSCGTLTKGRFDASTLFPIWSPPRYYSSNTAVVHTPRHFHKNQYVENLKALAGYWGYTPEDIDELLADGLSPEEIEEFFYIG